MITEIWVENEKIDLYSNSNISHTIQVNDIGEVKDRQASFTNSFSVPKTSNNVRIFDGLGISSDTSRTPYELKTCQLKIDGFSFIVDGKLKVSETSNDYKLHIYSGIVNFFKAIENKTVGDVIGEIVNHDKNLTNVVASFSNTPYRYLITDYGGLTHYQNALNETVINIDHLIPSISVEWLWNKIHEFFGFTFSGNVFENPDFTQRWLSYPKYVSIDDTTNVYSDFAGAVNYYANDIHYVDIASVKTDPIAEKGKYRLDIDFTLDFEANAPGKKIYFYVAVNGKRLNPNSPPSNAIYLVESFTTDGTVSASKILDLNVGDVLSVFIDSSEITNDVYTHVTSLATLDLINPASVQFNTGMSDLPVSTFIKEILVDYGLTMFYDPYLNKIEYLSVEDRVNNATIKDWTNKYIKRSSETYAYSNYAKANFFRYKYENQESSYHDASININNKNLEEFRTAFQSFTHSPELQTVPFELGGSIKFLRKFKMYNRETRTDKDGTEIVSYKGLDNRFYFMRESGIKYSGKIGSKTFNEEQDVTDIPIATFSSLDWNSKLKRSYLAFGQILNDSRIHTIELDLDLVDIATLDLKALYYFHQEQQFYIINKIQLSDGKAEGEFVRVKSYYDYVIIDDGEESDDTTLSLAIRWQDNTSADKTGTDNSVGVRISIIQAPTSNPFASMEWQKSSDGVTWTNLGSGANPYTVNLSNGDNYIRLMGTATDTTVVYSNILKYSKIVCRRYMVSTYGSSGDSIIVSYTDCRGVFDEFEVFPDYSNAISGEEGVSFYISTGYFCAVEGSVNASRGYIDNTGPC